MTAKYCRRASPAIEPQERRIAWATLLDSTYDDKAIAGAREKLRFPVKRVEDACVDHSAGSAASAYSIADIDAFAMLNPLPDLAPDIVNEAANAARARVSACACGSVLQ